MAMDKMANGKISAKELFGKVIALGIVIAFALAIRFYHAIKYPDNFRFGLGCFADSFLYHGIAYNLYENKGFSNSVTILVNGKKQQLNEPVITRGPVYPFFMSLIYKFFCNKADFASAENRHKNWDKVRIAQIFLDSGICLLVYFIVRFIYPASIWPALVASVLYCFSFYNIYYTHTLLSETIATFLLSLSFLAYIRALKQDSQYWLAASGVSLGFMILARPEYMLLPLVLAVYIYPANRCIKPAALKKSAVFLVSALMIVAVWTTRNLLVFKKPIIVSTGQLGYSLFLGTFEGNQKWQGWGNLPEEIPDVEGKKKMAMLYKAWDLSMNIGSIKIAEVDRCFMDLAFRRIQKHPFLCFKSWLRNFPRLWYQDYISMYCYGEASGGYFIFYLLFALFGFLISPRTERIVMAPVFLTFLYLSAIFFPLHIEPRYGVTFMPEIICLAGIGLWKSMEYCRNKIF